MVSNVYKQQAGFSLLEMMVAIVLLVTAFSIIWSTFSATLNAWERGSNLLDGLHTGDFIMEQVECAMRSAAYFDNKPEAYGFWLDDRGGGESSADEISWVTSGTALLPQESSLANGLHRLSITVEDNDDGKPSLAVKAWPHLADPEKIDDVEPWYISTEITGLDCVVYDIEDEDWTDDWEDTNSIPRLVQLTFYLPPIEKYGKAQTIQRLIEIPIAAPLESAIRAPGEHSAGGEDTDTSDNANASDNKDLSQPAFGPQL